MRDPRTFWLILTNIVLGALVVMVIWGVAAGFICEFVARFRRRRALDREIDRDMARYFGHHHLPK